MISKDLRRFITKALVKNLKMLIEPKYHGQIYIDKFGLNEAFQSSETDVRFIRDRRNIKDEDGVSDGKINGVLLFRLCKHKYLHIGEQAFGDASLRVIQEKASLITITEGMRLVNAVKHIRANTKKPRKVKKTKLANVVSELEYLITSRHYNQESLGVILDLLCHLEETINQNQDITLG